MAAFRPFQYNTVDWSVEYALYASGTPVQHGSRIDKIADKTASSKLIYTFCQGIFHNPMLPEAVGVNSYAVRNAFTGSSSFTFGLAQNVVVNGRVYVNMPINAIEVPYGQSAEMTPVEKLDLYLINDLQTLTVISGVTIPGLTVNYKYGEPEHTVMYNRMTGSFVMI